ncbi:Beta-glucuronidase [Paramyrothecium foliicola]|nr:Beta-glucuronidase [Paramyrothecium foliicola]
MARLLLLLGLQAGALLAAPLNEAPKLQVPSSPSAGASIEHHPSFSSFSIEPAFWVEFAGTAAEPNELFLKLITRLTDRGSQPILRPGGIAMDSLIFDPAGGDLVRSMGPKEVSFVSTLNFGNNSLDIARDLAVASVKHQADRIKYFEVGNEPNHFPKSRWNYETARYVAQWKNWTAAIDEATGRGSRQWWASSATTDLTALNVRPVDIIPLGVDSEDQVGQFSLHSYVYNTCNPAGAAAATIENLLNHTQIVTFADDQVAPFAKAALAHGKPWVMGEFNSVACSGKPNVTDTFTNALWIIDTQLTYAALNASSVNLHQGGTLVLQSNAQTNTPGFSAYSFVYPRDSEKWGVARANPGYGGLLFLAEVFSISNTRIQPLEAPEGVNSDHFLAYAAYHDWKLSKLILINMHPFYAKSADDYSVRLQIQTCGDIQQSQPVVKRLTAPSVNEKDTENVLWAGQSFKQGDPDGAMDLEILADDGTVTLRGSEAVIVLFEGDTVYSLQISLANVAAE